MSVIDVHELKKHFGKTKAVDGISFSVNKGEIFGFLGPNGAGKTTTIRCMMDFIRPLDGHIAILGRDTQKNAVSLKKDIGYLSGNVHLFSNWTGRMHIDFVRRLHGRADISNKLIKRLDFNPAMKTKQLSSGNKQKLGIILAFMLEPPILILDEPTLGLDPLLQNEIYTLLNEMTQKGSTVFMSSHNLAEVDRMCNKVGIIKQGRMVAAENITTLKEKKISTVHAYFTRPVDKKEFLTGDTELVKEVVDGLILKVRGDVNPLIKQLGKHELRDISIIQASLEDIFMEFYEKD